MKKSKSSKSLKDIDKEVKEARTLQGRKNLRSEIDQDASEWDVIEWHSQVSVSPYWDSLQGSTMTQDGEYQEDPCANPDLLPLEDSRPFHSNRVERLYNKLNISGKIDKLTDKEKEVLEMVCNGYSIGDTADMLNMTKSNVQDTLNRAKIKLKN